MGDTPPTDKSGLTTTATSGSVLSLSSRLLKQLERLAASGYPNEVCGLLVGRESDFRTEIYRVHQGNNLATDRLADRYLLDPGDFLATDKAARDDGLDIVGIWHTHPDQAARPSATDLQAAWEGYSYLILAVTEEGVMDRKCWRLSGSSFVPQRLEETTS